MLLRCRFCHRTHKANPEEKRWDHEPDCPVNSVPIRELCWLEPQPCFYTYAQAHWDEIMTT